MKRYIVFSFLGILFLLAGCFQAQSDCCDDLQTMPVTNNPNIIPNNSSAPTFP